MASLHSLNGGLQAGDEFTADGWRRPYLVPEREPQSTNWPALAYLFVVVLLLTILLLVIAGLRGA